jgi:hypothetical protein
LRAVRWWVHGSRRDGVWNDAMQYGLQHDMMVCSKLCSESSGSSIGKFYRGDPPGGCIASTRLTNCPSGW